MLKPGWESAEASPADPPGRRRRRDHRVRGARRRPLQHPARGPLPVPHPRGGARRDSLPRRPASRRSRRSRSGSPDEETRVSRMALAPLREDPGAARCLPPLPDGSPLSRAPGLGDRAAAALHARRSCRRCSRPTRSRRASARSSAACVEWQRRIQFLAPFRPGELDPEELTASGSVREPRPDGPDLARSRSARRVQGAVVRPARIALICSSIVTARGTVVEIIR